MKFEEFLQLVRTEIGNICTDNYWRWVYDTMKDKSEAHVRSELPYIAIHANATDYSGKYI